MLRWCLCLMAVFLLTACKETLPDADPRPGDEKLADAEWPQFRGPHRDDISADQGLLKHWPKNGPRIIWKAKGIGSGYSSVSLAGGKIFTLGNSVGMACAIPNFRGASWRSRTPMSRCRANFKFYGPVNITSNPREILHF